MTEIVQLTEPLTVAQRVTIGITVALVLLGALVLVTAIFVGLRRAVLAWIVLIAGGLVVFSFRPLGIDTLVSNPQPATSYEDAVARFEAHRDRHSQPLNPLCEPQLLTHGDADRTAIALLHGVSSCPQAFVDFAPYLFDRGHNVVTLRMPRNGFADRATDALDDLTAEQLSAFADEAVDIVNGLGDETVVLGISAGGTVAGFAGQTRSDLDRAVLVAPFFGLGGVGPRVNNVLMRLLTLAPAFSVWKDPRLREHYEGNMPHAYKRQSTRATGEIMRLGYAAFRKTRERAPATDALVVVTNEADTAVSQSTIDAFVRRWRRHGTDLINYQFPATHRLGHEIIDPLEPGAHTELTYPILAELVEGKQS